MQKGRGEVGEVGEGNPNLKYRVEGSGVAYLESTDLKYLLTIIKTVE